MPLKDLSGKTVYDLEGKDFEWLYCQNCKECKRCLKDQRTLVVCKLLVDTGAFDRHLRKV